MAIQPSKHFSQNFLVDTTTQQRIVLASDIQHNDTIVEIGPGTGALTQHILQTSAKDIWLIEKDPRCIEYITERFLTDRRIHLCHCDILQFNWSDIPTPHIRLIGSLPYHITSPILLHTLQLPHLQTATFVIQKEVGERIVAPTRSKAYGRLSVIMQLLTTPKILFTIPPEAFNPAPKVTSCAIHITPRENPTTPKGIKNLETVTHQCFQQRRKQLHNILKHAFPHIHAVCQHLNIDPQSRPETLCPQTFYTLSQHLMDYS